MGLYTKDGRNVDVEVTVWDIIEVISYSEDFVEKMIEENPSDYRYGLSFNEFLFLCLDLENPDILGEDVDAFYKFYYRYFKEIQYIEYIHILVDRSNGDSLPDFEINPRLLEKLNDNINPNYTTEERIVYYYFKLCFLLSIDNLYNFACLTFGEFGASNFKKAPNRLSEINDINNQAACFEFTAILDKLILMAGEYVAGWSYTGDRNHIHTEGILNRKLYRFDALEDPFGKKTEYRDILDVKLNCGYNGIVVDEDDLVRGVNSHSPFLDKIYNDVQNEFSWFLTQTKFSEEVMEECFSNIDTLNLDDSTKQTLKDYFNKFNSIPLNGIEYCIEILSSYKDLVEGDTNCNIQLTGVASTIDGYDFKIIMSIKINETDYIYFMFGKDNITILNRADMIKLLELNQIIVVQSKDKIDGMNFVVKYRTLPGIDEEFQIEMNKQAVKTVLWPMLQETYEDSLNIRDEEKKLVKSTYN